MVGAIVDASVVVAGRNGFGWEGKTNLISAVCTFDDGADGCCGWIGWTGAVGGKTAGIGNAGGG